MDCRVVKRTISSYLDDELREDEKEPFLSHIERCPACAGELTEMRDVHQLFLSAERFEAPYGFAARVIGRVGEPEGSWFARIWQKAIVEPLLLRTVGVAFALVIVAFGVISGRLLVPDRTIDASPVLAESFSLDLFQATPPGSVVAAYVSLTGGDR